MTARSAQLRVLSWNVGGQTDRNDLQRILAFVAEQDSDAVLLQEVEPAAEPILRRHLELRAFTVSWFDHRLGRGLLTATRDGHERLPTMPIHVPSDEADWFRRPRPLVGEPARILSVRVSTWQVTIHNVHCPPGSSKGWRKIDTLRALANCIEETHGSQVVAGDLNEPREESDDGAIATWAGRNKYSRRSLERWEAAVVSVLRGSKVRDAFWAANGHKALGMISFPRDGRRYDHVLASADLTPQTAEYLESDLCDHRPAQVILGRSEASAMK